MRAEFPAVQEARWNGFNSVVIGYKDAATRGRAQPATGTRPGRWRAARVIGRLRGVTRAARC